MDSTANLLLPFIMPAQAQKFITHNEALQRLDALVMLSVKDRVTSLPPGGAAEGDRYIVGPSPGGAWSGQAGKVASLSGGAWDFLAPREGWLAWCIAEGGLLGFSGGDWVATGAGAGGLQNVPMAGINATADTTNRLAVAADGVLLTHAGGSHRLVVNKHAATDTASLVLQDGFSGRAEIGLAGSDRLSIKVSADGSSFIEAVSIDNATGKPSFPQVQFLESYAVNLYQDSGRMSGNGRTAVTVSSFAFPAYLTLYNSATAASQGRFIHDNTDYGGAAGTMDSQVKALVDKIRDSADRRYGVEFFVAVLTMGTGTTDVANAGGINYYRMVFTAQVARPPALTFHAYLRALDDDVVMPLAAGQSAYKDGVTQTGTLRVTVADGWVSVTIRDSQPPRTSLGYAPETFLLRAKASGHRVLLACPALLGGLTSVDDNAGVIASYNSWSA